MMICYVEMGAAWKSLTKQRSVFDGCFDMLSRCFDRLDDVDYLVFMRVGIPGVFEMLVTDLLLTRWTQLKTTRICWFQGG